MKSSKRRGKITKSNAHNLLERLQKQEPSVLLFACKRRILMLFHKFFVVSQQCLTGKYNI